MESSGNYCIINVASYPQPLGTLRACRNNGKGYSKNAVNHMPFAATPCQAQR
jgi:hypothetical protein